MAFYCFPPSAFLLNGFLRDRVTPLSSQAECKTLKSILVIFDRAGARKVNLDESTIFRFSPILEAARHTGHPASGYCLYFN